MKNTEYKKILLGVVEDIHNQFKEQLKVVELINIVKLKHINLIKNSDSFLTLVSAIDTAKDMLNCLINSIDSDIKKIKRSNEIDEDLYKSWVPILRLKYSNDCIVTIP